MFSDTKTLKEGSPQKGSTPQFTDYRRTSQISSGFTPAYENNLDTSLCALNLQANYVSHTSPVTTQKPLEAANVPKKSVLPPALQPAVSVNPATVNNPQPNTTTVSPTLKVNPPGSAMLAQFKEVLKPVPKVNARDLKELGEFLRFVAEGEQDKAEAMLKNNPALALVPGNITDLSKRMFTGITAFQYAAWALDWHMWTMIRKCLPDAEAKKQAKGFETGSWVKKDYDVHAKRLLDNLVKAYQTTIDLYEQSKYDAADKTWIKQVGSGQCLLPVHVVNEYCHPARPFDPVPNFRDTLALPRSRTIQEIEWFANRRVGDFAFFRGWRAGGTWNGHTKSLHVRGCTRECSKEVNMIN